MTLIAYKNGILCADTQLNADDMRSLSPVVKIARDARGYLFAAAGSSAICRAWMWWFLEGMRGGQCDISRGDDDSASSVVIFNPADGSTERYVGAQKVSEFCAPDRLGLGWPSYLHGLMDGGLSARDAVATGIKRYTGADFPIIEIGHRGAPVIWETAERKMPIEAFERQHGRPMTDYFHPHE